MAISVVIPLFNKAGAISSAVASVLRQTVSDFELIVVDDGSTDLGGTQLQNLEEPRLRIIRQSNQGVSVARNNGVAAASHGLVAFLDADDEWDPRHLADLLSTFEAFPAAVSAGTAYRTIDDAGIERHLRLPASSERYFRIEDYFGFCSEFGPPFSSSTVAVRRSTFLEVGGFPPGVADGEDLVAWARMCCRGEVAFHSRESATYRVRSLRTGTVRRPAVPDRVGELLAELESSPGASLRLGEYRADWHRIRAVLFAELDERGSCVRELASAISCGGPILRDVLLASALLMPLLPRKALFRRVRARRLVVRG